MKKKNLIQLKPNFCGCGGKKIYGKKQGCCSPVKVGVEVPDISFGPGDNEDED